MEKKTGLIHFIPEWKCVDDQPDNNRRLHYSRFALSPLLVDQAMTIGVAIRRALLSEVEGISIVSANIVGALHEYSTLDGVRESVDEILLNLKQIVLKHAEDTSPKSFLLTSCKERQKEYRASIFAQGPGIVTAEHIKFPSSILAVDPDQPIATLLNETQLCLELFIQQGISKQLNRTKKHDSGFFLDAHFTPVQKANFSIHSVGDPKGLQQLLLLEIWTNKTVTPAEALYQAHASLLNLFHNVSPPIPSRNLVTPVSQTSFFSENGGHTESIGKSLGETIPVWDDHSPLTKTIEITTNVPEKTFQDDGRDVDRLLSREIKTDSFQNKNGNLPKLSLGSSSVRIKSFTDNNLSNDKQTSETFFKENLSIEELELSPRISNCLKRANIHTLADLLSYTQEDLFQIKNFGRKSVEQVSLVLRKRFNVELLPNK